MIIITTPYSLEKNLGKAYNEAMAMLPADDDWNIMRDVDTMFLDNKAPYHFAQAIKQKPDAGIFTCYASRTGRAQQKFNGTISPDPSLINHRKIAIRQASVLSLKPITEPIAGFCMAVKKSTWKQLGGFKEEGILSIDLDFSRRVLQSGLKIWLIESVYMLHYYRLIEGGPSYKEHLK